MIERHEPAITPPRITLVSNPLEHDIIELRAFNKNSQTVPFVSGIENRPKSLSKKVYLIRMISV